MTYEELNALKAGERLQVFDQGEWKSGTFDRFINGADPGLWFAFDERQQQAGTRICTRLYTGQQFKEEYWNQSFANKFRKLSEAELNAELLEQMEANV